MSAVMNIRLNVSRRMAENPSFAIVYTLPLISLKHWNRKITFMRIIFMADEDLESDRHFRNIISKGFR